MGEAPLLGLFGFRLGDLNRMKNEFVLAFNEMLDEMLEESKRTKIKE